MLKPGIDKSKKLLGPLVISYAVPLECIVWLLILFLWALRVTNQDTAMKVWHKTNYAAKCLGPKDLADTKDLALSDDNSNALLTYYKNSPPLRILPSDGNRNTLLAFYRNYGNTKGGASNTFNE